MIPIRGSSELGLIGNYPDSKKYFSSVPTEMGSFPERYFDNSQKKHFKRTWDGPSRAEAVGTKN
jgi:hypothetical protein